MTDQEWEQWLEEAGEEEYKYKQWEQQQEMIYEWRKAHEE